MNEVTEGWLNIAKENEECALELNEVVIKRKDRIICFLAQQAVEAYFKAALTFFESSKDPARTHDLSLLLGQIAKFRIPPSDFINETALLTPYATVKRYEIAEKISENESRMAVHAMKVLASWIEEKCFGGES